MARAIVRAWRRLVRACLADDGLATPGQPAERSTPTLVACSGGADSICLAAVLVAAGGRGPITLAHVVHRGMRPDGDLKADAASVRAFAEQWGVGYAQRDVLLEAGARSDGSTEEASSPPSEATFRRGRYAALQDMADETGARIIVTGHHADDQLETVLLALLRGAGPRGLAGMPDRRRLKRPTGRPTEDASGEDGRSSSSEGRAAWLVRPMLRVTRADAEALCRSVGIAWRTDASNADESLLRNALRAHVTPTLEALRPGVAGRVARATPAVRAAADALQANGAATFAYAAIEHDHETAGGDSACEARGRLIGVWRRKWLTHADPAVLSAGLQHVVTCAQCESRGAAQSSATLAAAARAIADGSSERREVELGASVSCIVHADRVMLVDRRG